MQPSAGGIVAHARAEAARQRAEAEKRKNHVTRFWVGRDEKDGREIVILDESIEAGFQCYEHKLKGPDGKWDRIEPCVKTYMDCPLCKHTDKRSSLVTFLTVLDLKPYTNSKDETVPYSRRLLAINANQLEQFYRLELMAKEEGKSLRGMYLVMARDGGDKSPAIGSPIPQANVKGGPTYQIMSEAELVKEFGHPARKDKDGKVFLQSNELLHPYNYTEIFPEPSDDYIAGLAKEFGGESAKAQKWDDSEASDAPPPVTRAATKVAKKGAKPAPAPEPEPEPGPGPEEEDLATLGATADDSTDEGADSAAARLTELCSEKGIDPNAYDTWVAVAEALADGIPMEDDADGSGEAAAGTWAEYGASVDNGEDSDGAQEEALNNAAAQVNVDPNDYATWQELGVYLDSLQNGGDGEAEGAEDGEGALDYTELGTAADDDDEDAQNTLREAAVEAGLDPDDANAYPNWADLAAALTNPEEAGAEAEAEEVNPLLVQAEAADESPKNVAAAKAVEKAAKAAGLDPNEYNTWVEVADAVIAAQEAEASEAPAKKSPAKDPFRRR